MAIAWETLAEKPMILQQCVSGKFKVRLLPCLFDGNVARKWVKRNDATKKEQQFNICFDNSDVVYDSTLVLSLTAHVWCMRQMCMDAFCAAPRSVLLWRYKRKEDASGWTFDITREFAHHVM
eukprot:120283-Amphidinium_carterae.1